ncbi:MAG: nitroreductase family protein [Colwellia sp.]
MNAIQLLLQRQSTATLTSPAPTDNDLHTLLAAGMRVPDHAGLKPWHFHVISGQGLQRLSKLYVEAIDAEFKNNVGFIRNTSIDSDTLNAKKEKTAKMPFRAPMIIVISTKYIEHDNVPKQEQLIAAGCSAHAMQMAAYALGYAAMWRTGDLAYNAIVKKGLALEEGDDIAGFLYIGTATKVANIKPTKNYQGKVTVWN